MSTYEEQILKSLRIKRVVEHISQGLIIYDTYAKRQKDIKLQRTFKSKGKSYSFREIVI